jgi:hypothetical protein
VAVPTVTHQPVAEDQADSEMETGKVTEDASGTKTVTEIKLLIIKN